MLIVVTETRLQATGHASALVALGFFAGFMVGTPAFGALVDASRSYTPGWLLVAALFAAATVLALGWHRSRPNRAATDTAS
jgi:cyanate permease